MYHRPLHVYAHSNICELFTLTGVIDRTQSRYGETLWCVDPVFLTLILFETGSLLASTHLAPYVDNSCLSHIHQGLLFIPCLSYPPQGLVFLFELANRVRHVYQTCLIHI